MDIRKSIPLETPLFEMAMKRTVLIQEVRSLRKQINLHLLKILIVQRPHTEMAHWTSEISAWLEDIALMRVKNGNKPLKPGEYFELLFSEPFVGTAYAHVLARQIRHSGYQIDPSVTIASVDQKIRAFHSGFDKWASAGPDMSDDHAVRAAMHSLFSVL